MTQLRNLSPKVTACANLIPSRDGGRSLVCRGVCEAGEPVPTRAPVASWHRLPGMPAAPLSIVLLVAGLLALTVLSLGLGRCPLDPLTVVRVLAGQVIDVPGALPATEQR